MKKFLVVFFIALPLIVLTQELKPENGKIIWQKIEESDLSKEDIASLMRKSGNFNDLGIQENSIYAEINPFLLDRKLSEADGSLYMWTDDMTGKVIVDFKEDRYRVTVKNIAFISNTNVTAIGDGIGARMPMERIAFKNNGDFRKIYLKRDKDVIEANLTKLFQFTKTNDDW